MAARVVVATFLAAVCSAQFRNDGRFGDGGYRPPDYYGAVVVVHGAQEHSPTTPPQSVVQSNGVNYAEYMRKAKQKWPTADIIVFPESGLTTVGVQDKIKDYSTEIPSTLPSNPCISGGTGVLQTLSCAARNHNITAVVNLPEIANCNGNDCPSDRRCVFNTNLVFDKDGNIIARYRRKSYTPNHACGVDSKDSTFHAAQDVTFGILNTHDLLHREPATTMISQGISNFVYLGAWRSELPFLTGVQVQEGWARGLKVNLLAAGYEDPIKGYTGSGIYPAYRGGNTDASTPFHKMSDNLIFSYLPKPMSRNTGPTPQSSPHTSNYVSMHDFKFLKDNLKPYKTELLEKANTNTTVCDGRFCCIFNIVAEGLKNDKPIRYRLVAYNGTRNYDNGTIGIQVCAIVSCNNESLSSCGSPVDGSKSSVFLKNVSIRGEFNDYGTYMPTTLLGTLLPVPKDQYTSTRHLDTSGKMVYNITSTAGFRDVQTFGIYSRIFEYDGQPARSGENTKRLATPLLGFVLMFVFKIILQ